MTVPAKASSAIWLTIRLVSLGAAVSLFVLCLYLYILHGVDDFYHPNEPLRTFWLVWVPLFLAASYLLFVGFFGRLRPATASDWLRGISLAFAVFAALWFVAPAIYRHMS